MNSIDICNLALASLGNTRMISSVGDQSTEAALCGRFYDMVRKSLLKLYGWGFATVMADLTITEETNDKYTYVYEYPEDCLRVMSVYAPGDTTSADYVTYTVDGDIQKVRRIATDVEDARISYIYDVQDCDTMPAEFIDALALSLASRLALPLASDGRLAQAVGQQAALAVDTAKRMCAVEQKRPMVTENKYSQARR